MTCPACGAFSRVLETRRRNGGTVVYRRRQCLRRTCKHRWTTEEGAPGARVLRRG